MKLLHPVHDGKKLHKVGDYKKGSLPKDIESDLIDKGYFELDGDDNSSQDVNTDDLKVSGIQKLPIKKLTAALGGLSNDELIELHELESNSKNPRDGALAAIDAALTD